MSYIYKNNEIKFDFCDEKDLINIDNNTKNTLGIYRVGS